jgi:hypothetical protein
VDRALNVRLGKEDSRKRVNANQVIDTLLPGERVKIPDSILPVALRSGKFRTEADRERAILMWLKRAVKAPSSMSQGIRRFSYVATNKKKYNDYFVPVEVLDKNGESTQTKGWVHLRSLLSVNGGIFVSEATQVYDQLSPEKSETARPLPQTSNLSARSTEGATALGCSNNCSPFNATQLRQLGKDFLRQGTSIASALDKVDVAKERRAKGAGTVEAIRNTFNKTCGMPFDTFKKVLDSESRRSGIPSEFMLSMMQIESSGNCKAHNANDPGGSVGLFQINWGTHRNGSAKKYKRCLSGSTKNSSAINNPANRCIENPINNLKVSLKIVGDMYKTVNGQLPPDGDTGWSHLSPRSRDAWRKTLSAYNGGQAYVIQAYKDMQDYNARYFKNSPGDRLDSENWEHRRLFLMRFYLARKDQSFVGPRKKTYSRTSSSILNLTHVEAILGRETDSPEAATQSIISRW